MKKLVIFILMASLLVFAPRAGADRPASAQAVGQPVLKWAYGGCYASWCETGWYSSTAVADLDGDGTWEVIASAYSIFVLDGASGNLEWQVSSGHDRSQPGESNVGRTWPGVVVSDVDGNGDLEIVTAHAGGYVSVYDHQGYFQPGWPQQPTPGSELRSLGVYDLDGDGTQEILVAATRSNDQWYVFQPDGTIRPGDWPQHGPDSDTNGYTSGAYNQNLAAGDLDGDGRAEISGPNDTHYIAAFHEDGAQVQANPIYAPVIVDVDGDGQREVVVVGNVYNCGTSPYTSLYEMPYIFNGDRTRWQGAGFDWTAIPAPDAQAAPLSEDYNRIESSLPNPSPADLDGDGRLEIIFPSYDGRVHAYWLDKTEHGNWPYSVTRPGEGFLRFASEAAVADLDGDGLAEVVFASWTEKGSGQNGKLHILDYLGNPIWEIDLPPSRGGSDWNGGLAAPTLANIDSDSEFEVVLNTAHSGVVAYDLPGTSAARLLWATGRGSYQRSGSFQAINPGPPDLPLRLFLPLVR